MLQIVQMKKVLKEDGTGGCIYHVALSDGDSYVDGALAANCAIWLIVVTSKQTLLLN